MKKTSCSVDTCNEDARTKGMCRSHYNKARYAANKEHMRSIVKAYQIANPEKYAATQEKYRKANVEKIAAQQKRSYNKRVNNPKLFKGEPVSTAEVTYVGAHRRITLNRGLASLHTCLCGKQAEQWSHNHSQNEYTRQELKKDFQGKDVYMDYSLDIWDYNALCRSCHTKFDKYGILGFEYERISA